jgi:hypothetical protein
LPFWNIFIFKLGELIMEASLEDAKLKALVKETLVELLEERREEFSELLLEALEDLALSQAIREGENSGLVDKKEILRIIASRA